MFRDRREEGEGAPMPEAAPKPEKRKAVTETKPQAADVLVVDRGNRHCKVPIVFTQRTAEYRPGQTGIFPMWEANRIVDAGRARFAPNVVFQK